MDFDLKRSPRLMSKLLSGQQQTESGGVITAWDSSTLGALHPEDLERLAWMIDICAKLSAQAQGLRAPITSATKLQMLNQTLYLAVERMAGDRVRILGLLKTGFKKLFLRTDDLKYHALEPRCVLDFYVQEQHQRSGIGMALFQAFLSAEAQTASSVAYDAPSPKLLAFLQKHFGLVHYEPQDNKFVVFPPFWSLSDNHVPNGLTVSDRWASIAARPLTPPRRRFGVPAAAGSRPATVHGYPHVSRRS